MKNLIIAFALIIAVSSNAVAQYKYYPSKSVRALQNQVNELLDRIEVLEAQNAASEDLIARLDAAEEHFAANEDLIARLESVEAQISINTSNIANTPPRYTDEEARTAVGPHYTDARAVTAVGPHFSGDHDDLINVTGEQHHVPISSDISDLEAAVAHYDVLFDGVSRVNDEFSGYDTLLIEGMNLQITNGMGYWFNQSDIPDYVNGVGNLIIGYNRHQPGFDQRTGSHNLIVGDFHNYSGYGGLVAGIHNTVSGQYSGVMGGYYNSAIGDHTTVLGGQANQAIGYNSSVSGGVHNDAHGDFSSILGGFYKTAGSTYCVVGDDEVDCP